MDWFSVFIGLMVGSFVTAIIADFLDEDIEAKAEMFDRLFSEEIMSKKTAARYMQKLRDLYYKK